MRAISFLLLHSALVIVELALAIVELLSTNAPVYNNTPLQHLLCSLISLFNVYACNHQTAGQGDWQSLKLPFRCGAKGYQGRQNLVCR
jgi:hypothetical protein